VPWAKRAKRPIPPITSSRQTIEINDYSLGMNSFTSNDKFPVVNGGSNMWRLAQDARILTLGNYDTRKGFDFHSVAAGETLDQSITSVTGAADRSFSTTTWLAQKVTVGATAQTNRLDVNIKNDASATGVPIFALYSDNAGSPGTFIALSSVAPGSLTSSYAYSTVRFAVAPAQTSATVYWIVGYVQTGGTGSYKWSSTSSAATAKVSSDSGMTWSSTSYGLNVKQYYATGGAAKGLARLVKSDGTKVTLFAHNTSLYTVDNVTGALTAIKTGLSASATLYRFQIANDIIYYVNGYDGYRKWDFVTESQINATNYNDICLHKGLMFLVRTDDPDRFDFSGFATYETFASTDFVDVPAPKSGDPIASIISINSYLLIRTLNRCFIYSGDDNSTFRLDAAPDQKGTFTPKTVCQDKNYTYFLSDDGVYKSNGTQPTLISQNNYEAIRSLANKANCCMALSKGRLYLWYSSAGSSYNDSCYVWDLNGDKETIESQDTDAFVSHAVSSFRDNDDLLVASSIIGQVYWQELASNDYNNLGGNISWLLATHYLVGASPAVLKEYRYWEPRFGAQSGNYTVDCQYAYDQRNNWQTYQSVSVQGSGAIWGSGILWGAFTWGTTAEVQSQLYIPGEYRRTAVRYKHFATRQPNQFLGHTFVSETRRIR
jgi:hypothetical protein